MQSQHPVAPRRPQRRAARPTSGEFDPYHRWLGIPPQEQPADNYRLLGLARFEEDPDVVEDAADRQMAHVRRYQMGKHAAVSQRILNELAAAKLCLLDPDKKSKYDDALWQELDAQAADLSDTPVSRADEPEEPAEALLLGEYYLEDLLGSSSTGPVYKARHRTLGRVVALKLLSSEAAQSPETVARFRRKVSVMGRLNHPHLVAAYDAGERDGIHFLIMECVEGRDLIALLKQYNVLPVRHVIDYIAQAAAGLGYAHRQGVVHRNIKPNNLLVDDEGTVKVIGLGLALPAGGGELPSLEDEGRMIGTIDYMAPEQAVDSAAVDGRSDIYSLGCTLFTVLTRRLLFPVKNPRDKLIAHRQQPAPSLRSFRPDVPASLDAVFQKMVAKRPEDRFATMEQAAAELERCLAHLDSLPSPAASFPTSFDTPGTIDSADVSQFTIRADQPPDA
jgi:hypothetical protein